MEDQSEWASRLRSAKVRNEGRLGFSHEAVGLMPVKAPLDRHHAP